MTTGNAYLIVGAGLAGAKAAETLRAEGFDGPVIMIGEETDRHYERPPLSKDYLLGKTGRERTYVHPQALIRTGRPVDKIALCERQISLDLLANR